MAKPIAVQLYSLREAARADFVGVLKKVAAMGYKGVEPAGLHGMTPKEFRTVVDDLGMRIASSHGPRVSPDNLEQVIEWAGIFGTDLMVTGYGPEDFADVDTIKATAEKVNAMVPVLADAGIKLSLHNHYWEFSRVDGRIAYDLFAEACPDVYFEIDIYWAANFGANDPAEQVAKFKDRALLLHVKDGPLEKGAAMVAVGSGKMDMEKVIPAADPDLLRWLIVELDDCDTDMFEAVEQSRKYLMESGLGA